MYSVHYIPTYHSTSITYLLFVGSDLAAADAPEGDEEEEVNRVTGSVCAVSREGSYCSEEEVFEGYVDEETIGGDVWEEESRGDGARQVPAHLLTELKSVLTIRNHERERKKMHRRGNQLRGVEPTPPLEASEHDGENDRLQPEHQQGDKYKVGDATAAERDSIPLSTQTYQPSTDRFPLSLSAEMAAAIRRRQPTHTEDVFS